MRYVADQGFSRSKKYLRGSKSQRYFANKKGPSPYRTRIISPSYQKKIAHIGRPMGRGTSKRHVVVTSTGKVMGTRTLYSRDISYVPRARTGNPTPIDGRNRAIINLRGVKLEIAAINSALIQTSPMVLQWAIIHDKGRANPLLSKNDPISTDNFFRGDKGTRAIDFTDDRSGAEINTQPINADLYVTLKRGKKILQPRVTSNGLIPSCSTMISEYIPINRQITYDDEDPVADNFAVDGRLFLCYWCERLQGATTGSLSSAASVFLDKHVVAYYDEPTD